MPGGPDDYRFVRIPAADLVSERKATFWSVQKYRQTIAAAAVVLEEFCALTAGGIKYATAEADNIKDL